MKRYKIIIILLTFIRGLTYFFGGYAIPFVIFVDWRHLLWVVIAIAVNLITRDAIEIIKIKDFRHRFNTSDIGGE